MLTITEQILFVFTIKSSNKTLIDVNKDSFQILVPTFEIFVSRKRFTGK